MQDMQGVMAAEITCSDHPQQPHHQQRIQISQKQHEHWNAQQQSQESSQKQHHQQQQQQSQQQVQHLQQQQQQQQHYDHQQYQQQQQQQQQLNSQQNCIVVSEGGGQHENRQKEFGRSHSKKIACESIEIQNIDIQIKQASRDERSELEGNGDLLQDVRNIQSSSSIEQLRGQAHTGTHTSHHGQRDSSPHFHPHPSDSTTAATTSTSNIPSLFPSLAPTQPPTQQPQQFSEAVLTLGANHRKSHRRTESNNDNNSNSNSNNSSHLNLNNLVALGPLSNGQRDSLPLSFQGLQSNDDLNEMAPWLINGLREGRLCQKDVEEFLLRNSGAESINELIEWRNSNNNNSNNNSLNNTNNMNQTSVSLSQLNQIQTGNRLPQPAIIDKGGQHQMARGSYHGYNQSGYGGHNPQNGRRGQGDGYKGGGMRKSQSRDNGQSRKGGSHGKGGGSGSSHQHLSHAGLTSQQLQSHPHQQQQQYRSRQSQQQQQTYQMQHQQQQIGSRHKKRGEQSQQQQFQQHQQSQHMGEDQFRQTFHKQVLEQGPNATMDIERFLIQIMPTIKVKRSKGKNVVEAVSDIRLSELWEFYHLPSFFGREIFTMGGSRGPSLAYYVPYLSAIQLFVSAQPKDPGVDSIYICKQTPEGFSPNMHLLFEFFEREQPHNRCPMYLQLQRIANGQHEDFPISVPEIMNQKMSTLHPASWFAVAWYPLYRIPDSSLTGRFLTYHSLTQAAGTIKHLEQHADTKFLQQTPWQMIYLQPDGLKYYNLTSEKWFGTDDGNRIADGRDNLSQSGCSSVSDMDPGMRHQFEKLELEAEKFSTGEGVKKLGQAGVEYRKQEHPDFKFFSSRS